MLVDCPQMEQYRSGCDLGSFVRLYKSLKPQFSSIKIYALYLDDRRTSTVQKKALALCHMKIGWHKLMKIDL